MDSNRNVITSIENINNCESIIIKMNDGEYKLNIKEKKLKKIINETLIF